MYGGVPCPGPSLESRRCISEWSEWVPCNATCDFAGLSYRTRAELNPPGLPCAVLPIYESFLCLLDCSTSGSTSTPTTPGVIISLAPNATNGPSTQLKVCYTDPVGVCTESGTYCDPLSYRCMPCPYPTVPNIKRTFCFDSSPFLLSTGHLQSRPAQLNCYPTELLSNPIQANPISS